MEAVAQLDKEVVTASVELVESPDGSNLEASLDLSSQEVPSADSVDSILHHNALHQDTRLHWYEVKSLLGRGGFGITYSPLFYEKFYWYLTDNSTPPIKPEDVDTSELWLLEEGNCFRDQISDFCRLKKNHARSLVYKCSSIDSLIRMVDHQGGTTILPELTTIGLSGEQEERIVQIGVKAREISLITRTNPGKKRFLDALEKITVQ